MGSSSAGGASPASPMRHRPSGRPLARAGAAADALAWLLNVSTSVLIVFVNKLLMDPKQGHGFSFATTLCAFHFLSAAACVTAAQLAGLAARAHLPWRVALQFAVVASLSIASLNLSLLVNSVGFYQVAKLLIIPFVCAVELLWMGRRFPPRVLASIATVIVGVAIVTVTDVNVRPLGLLVAAVSVVSSGLQQVMCGAIQRAHRLQSHQLLANTAPMQGLMLLVVGPFVDQFVSGAWVGDFGLSAPAALCLLLSCGVSVAVNISQFMCLGRFSAVTFQVLGHTKTVVVLLASWLALHEPMSARKACGMLLAVAGMVGYGYFTSGGGNSSGSGGRISNNGGGPVGASKLSVASGGSAGLAAAAAAAPPAVVPVVVSAAPSGVGVGGAAPEKRTRLQVQVASR